MVKTDRKSEVVKIKMEIKTVYFQVTSTWNLDVVAYIIHKMYPVHTAVHTYILTHFKVNLCRQSPKYHKTPSLKYTLVCKLKF